MTEGTEGTEANPVVAALRERIAGYLRDAQLEWEERGGHFILTQGSTAVTIAAETWGEARTIVRILSPVAIDIQRITPELTQFLVTENNSLLFGKFSLDVEGRTVWYEHALLGDFMQAEELLVAAAAVATTADEYDERVSELAQGHRAAD